MTEMSTEETMDEILQQARPRVTSYFRHITQTDCYIYI